MSQIMALIMIQFSTSLKQKLHFFYKIKRLGYFFFQTGLKACTESYEIYFWNELGAPLRSKSLYRNTEM